jgi:hypothetical protein
MWGPIYALIGDDFPAPLSAPIPRPALPLAGSGLRDFRFYPFFDRSGFIHPGLNPDWQDNRLEILAFSFGRIRPVFDRPDRAIRSYVFGRLRRKRRSCPNTYRFYPLRDKAGEISPVSGRR